MQCGKNRNNYCHRNILISFFLPVTNRINGFNIIFRNYTENIRVNNKMYVAEHIQQTKITCIVYVNFLIIQLFCIFIFRKFLWLGLGFMVFNVTINNISVISWQSVLLVEETGGSRENN